MKRGVYLVICAVIVVVLLPAAAAADSDGAAYVTPLIAGQHIGAGRVSVWNDADYLYVSYRTGGGWLLYETHLYLGLTPPESAAPGLFPYKHEGLGGRFTDFYRIPLDGWDTGTTLYIAAQAEVCTRGDDSRDCPPPAPLCETAWAYGPYELPGANWGWYFDYTVRAVLGLDRGLGLH